MLENLRLVENDQPLYRRLADAIADRIERGELSPGDRLPPQRDIAKALGINVTTVTRAFLELQQRGLVEARPGRGSTVASRAAEDVNGFKSAPSDESGLIDLSVNRPPTTAYLDAVSALLPRLAKDRRYAALQDYHPPEGPAWAREAAAAWFAPVAGGGDPSRIILTDGAQHGLACVLAAIAERGDIVVADSVTYQGINALCHSQGLELRGLPMDREGMRPEAFESACAQWRPKAVFLVPSLHNPTTVTLSEARRRAIVATARRHNVIIIEDDVYRPLLEESLPSFAGLEPELTFHIGALSKCVAPGLRLGFVIGPRALMSNVAASLRIDCWSISPLTALIGSTLLESGMAARIIATQREELRRRNLLLREAMGRFDIETHPTSTHAWLHLPEPWRGAGFARACRQRGVGVLSADAFAVGREPVPHAVRLNIGAARSRADLSRALEILADLMESGHLQIPGMV
ncbi:MAG TPA: PLP-dependent aminotransferase family protein [Dongiaceae bacterium]|nr:PLP-dependent aminotransferase family protein [Dongiaceae bacterium]